MINIRLLTAAAAAVALLCLTGCQPKEDPLYLGNNAIVLETDEGRNGLYVKDADNGGASGDSLFGERCFIDCSHAQLYYYGLGTEELTEMKLGDLLAGDEVTIDLRESEVKKAGSGSASAEKIQLMTQRMCPESLAAAAAAPTAAVPAAAAPAAAAPAAITPTAQTPTAPAKQKRMPKSPAAGLRPWKNRTIKALPNRFSIFSRSAISKRWPGSAPIPFT